MKNQKIIIGVIIGILIIGSFFIFKNLNASKDRLRIGDVVNADIQSPHPYPNAETSDTSLVWSYTLNHPGAAWIRLHFNKFKLSEGDFVLIKDNQGNVLDTLTSQSIQKEENIWSKPYGEGNVNPLDTIIIELHADNSNNDYGIYIEEYGRGYTEEEIKQVNQEEFEKLLKECEEKNISLEECPAFWE